MTEQKRCSCCNGTVPCGCCAGTEAVTPLSVINRPGLDTIAYRVGTHATFLETMKARLSNLCVDDENGEACKRGQGSYPLQKLTTRAANDPAIALLDAWATVADVLTFYQERIANEGYLRTATERRSILELARLIGYALRPGVSASVFLAYTIDANFKGPVEMPIGTRSQSVPGPGELPQSFETSEVLDARAAWNLLKPRLSQPQLFETIKKSYNQDQQGCTLYLKGIATNLKPNDRLLLVNPQQNGTEELRLFVRVNDVQPDPKNDRTLVNLKAVTTRQAGVSDGDKLLNVMTGLSIPPSVPPANTLRLSRSVKDSFAIDADTGLQIVNTLRPDFREALPTALANVPVTPANPLEVHSFRVKAGVYGSHAPLKSITDEKGREIGKQEWPLNGTQTVGVALKGGRDELQTATISVANADKRLRLTFDIVSLPREKEFEQTLGDVKFAFDAWNKFPKEFHLTYSSEAGSTQLTYQRNIGNPIIDLTISVNGKPEQKINFALGQTASAAIQSHNWKIEYFMDESDENEVLSVTDEAPLPPDSKNRIALDGVYDQIARGSWFVIQRQGKQERRGRVKEVQNVAKTDYNFPAKVTELTLYNAADTRSQDWLTADDLLLSDIRSTTVFVQSEKLELAEEPVTQEICGNVNNQIVEIELDGLYTDLKSGRWLIVAGERADIKDENKNIVDGLKSVELVMLAGVRHGHRPDLIGDKTHTFITLAKELAYCYRRDKVTIYANVVRATHGETRPEVLGSGNGSKALQKFSLRQPPLTYVSSPNPAGAESTLSVFVNDVRWHETDTLFGLPPSARRFITQTSDDGITTAIFGNGQDGARLPTGAENIRAEYRQGIGKGGNVKAEQISLLVSRPLGVKEVINPQRAAGGADKESRDQARKNAPLAVLALDRLVSTQDYSDFARTFAGVGKAFATRLSDGRRELVHVTIAGVDDVPIDETSDLFRNLKRTLHQFGEPAVPVTLAVRELMLLIISAKVRLLPDYQWEAVAPKMRRQLLEAFGFERRELGQDVTLSKVISTMHRVTGVAYVDVDEFGGVAEKNDDGTVRTPKQLLDAAQKVMRDKVRTPEQLLDATQKVMRDKLHQRVRVNLPELKGTVIRPAQLAYLAADVQDTLILNLI